MRLLSSKISMLTMLILLSFQSVAQEQETVYERRVERYKSVWDAIIPKYAKTQFAGSMGMLSFGGGWNYGKDHWETDLLFGFAPKSNKGLSDNDRRKNHTLYTFTVKQNYIPWRLNITDKIFFEPLTTGIYFNTLFNNEYWNKSPSKYPDGYYFFSTRLRTHIFVGERITFKLNKNKYPDKSITLFYELSTCDLYVISRVQNSYLKPSDYLSLSFGVKFQIL